MGPKGSYRIVKWEDSRGANTVAGIVKGPRTIASIGGSGVVEVPVGARVYVPHRPVMQYVGQVR